MALSNYGIVKCVKWCLRWVGCFYCDSLNKQMGSLILEGHNQPHYHQELLLRLMRCVFKLTRRVFEEIRCLSSSFLLFHMQVYLWWHPQLLCKCGNQSTCARFYFYFLFFVSVIFVRLNNQVLMNFANGWPFQEYPWPNFYISNIFMAWRLPDVW